jgi:hypothetical protein
VVLKILGIAILGILSFALLLKVVLPAGALVLGLGIDVPDNWSRSWKALFVYSHPAVTLLVGAALLALFCWGVTRLLGTARQGGD